MFEFHTLIEVAMLLLCETVRPHLKDVHFKRVFCRLLFNPLRLPNMKKCHAPSRVSQDSTINDFWSRTWLRASFYFEESKSPVNVAMFHGEWQSAALLSASGGWFPPSRQAARPGHLSSSHGRFVIHTKEKWIEWPQELPFTEINGVPTPSQQRC